MVNITKDFIEESVWLEAWVGVATSSSCQSRDVARGWADECLKEFKKRFLNNKSNAGVV